ncbi:MAG: acyl-CoA thioesterase II [Steroidobacteraceae bacterium]
MSNELRELLKLHELEPLEVNLFRGESRSIGSPQVFGGQVLAQALVAAMRTVEGRVAHSLHAYFLRRGDFNAPIVYQVERSRDGGSFSSRRVSAIQHGEQILTMSASFQEPQPGYEHQLAMPDVPAPETLEDQEAYVRRVVPELSPQLAFFLERVRPWRFRPVELRDPHVFEAKLARRRIWFRLDGELPDDDALHRALLTYVSDYNLLDVATMPHGRTHIDLTMASIDHALWFHRPMRVNDWLLYDIESPSACGARGFCRASIFTRDGCLVASAAQEGLMRPRRT